MRQTFERIVDRKATIVQSLAKDLEEAEQQYQVALRTHLQNMDQLMGMITSHSIIALRSFYKYHISSYCLPKLWSYSFLTDFQVKRTKKLENEYQTELKTLKAEFDTERCMHGY